MVLSFTDAEVKSLEAPSPEERQRDYWDPGMPGFGVRVGFGGRRVFVVRYRNEHGRLRRMTLGRYPILSLAAARKRAKVILGDVVHGYDPAQERQDARHVKTFGEVCDAYLEFAAAKHRTYSEERRIIEKDLAKRWGNWAAKDVKRVHVRELVDCIALKRKAPVMANRTLGLISRIFNFALDREWVEFTPAARVRPPGDEQSRERVLTAEEIRTLWAALESIRTHPEWSKRSAKSKKWGEVRTLPPVSPALAAAFQVQLLTAQRPGEVRGMRWEDLDLDEGWWTIPSTDAKNRRAHRVPLSDTALAIIVALLAKRKKESRFVFENFPGGGSVQHRGKKAAAALCATLPFTFRAHDLRRTAATEMAKAGVRRDHIARVLNHIEGGPSATRVYDRYEYDAEKREALTRLADRIAAILAGPAKVLPLTSMNRGA